MIWKFLQKWFNAKLSLDDPSELPAESETPVTKKYMGFEVYFDGEHIANLEHLSYDHPFNQFRILPLTTDRDKLRDALDSMMFRGPRGNTILMFETKDYYFKDHQFGSGMYGLDRVSVRFFGGPHRVDSEPPEE